jgi:hypothetical protein
MNLWHQLILFEWDLERQLGKEATGLDNKLP